MMNHRWQCQWYKLLSVYCSYQVKPPTTIVLLIPHLFLVGNVLMRVSHIWVVSHQCCDLQVLCGQCLHSYLASSHSQHRYGTQQQQQQQQQQVCHERCGSVTQNVTGHDIMSHISTLSRSIGWVSWHHPRASDHVCSWGWSGPERHAHYQDGWTPLLIFPMS